MNRRNTTIVAVAIVVLIAAGAGSLLILQSTSQQPQLAKEVKIGLIASLTGSLAPYGVSVLEGARLAVAEINEKGGILGAKVVLVEVDDRSTDVKEAVTGFTKMVEADKVVGVVGITSSTIIAGVREEAEKYRVPVILNHGTSDRTLTKSLQYTFRGCTPAATSYTKSFADFIIAQGLRRVAILIASYEYGYSIRDALNKHLSAVQGMNIQVEEAPLTETDFTPYLRKLLPMNPDVLVVTGHPGASPIIIKQALEMGFQSRYYVAASHSPSYFVSVLGEDIFKGVVISSCTDYSSQAYKQVAVKYFKTYNKFMDHNAVSGYVSVYQIANAVEKTRSTDPSKIADYLRNNAYEHPLFVYPLSYTEWGELKAAKQALFIFRRGNPGAINPGANWVLDLVYMSSPVEPFVPAQ
ncbi:MAG: ABC transporter substrate-binding protein [Candidatus Caldarchaeum sp.]